MMKILFLLKNMDGVCIVAQWIGELTLNLSGFSPLSFDPRSGHM